MLKNKKIEIFFLVNMQDTKAEEEEIEGWKRLDDDYANLHDM